MGSSNCQGQQASYTHALGGAASELRGLILPAGHPGLRPPRPLSPPTRAGLSVPLMDQGQQRSLGQAAHSL